MIGGDNYSGSSFTKHFDSIFVPSSEHTQVVTWKLTE
jgi:hypothetical protein